MKVRVREQETHQFGTVGKGKFVHIIVQDQAGYRSLCGRSGATSSNTQVVEWEEVCGVCASGFRLVIDEGVYE